VLKKYQYFFIVLFLGSMLFTVFQYIPILEEEAHASKTLSKKSDDTSNEKDSTDDDSGDDENDTDDLFAHTGYNDFLLFSTHSKHHAFNENYQSLVFNITTPPPKI
jgi:hypothetical protein